MRGWWLVVALSGCAHFPRAELEQSCRDGSSHRCVELTRQLMKRREDGAAVAWLEYACALGDQHSCVVHGGMYEWGRGVPEDRAHARRLYESACQRGSSEACEWRDRLDAQEGASECKPKPGDGLEKSAIKAVIDLQQEAVRVCYESVIWEDHTPSVDVSMAWVIGADGRVVSAAITKDTRPDLGVGACIRDQVLRWRFPCPAGGGVVNVTFPWLLRPKE